MTKFLSKGRSVGLAAAATGTVAGIALAATGATAGPTDRVDVGSIGRNAAPVTAGAPSQRPFVDLSESGAADVNLSTTRAVTAPGRSRSAAKWLVAATRDGGACISIVNVATCASAHERDLGRFAVTSYPPGKVLGSADPKTGLVPIEPSAAPGIRNGVAPADATSVEVISSPGDKPARSAVDHGLYSIGVPAQGSATVVRYLNASGKVLAEDRDG